MNMTALRTIDTLQGLAYYTNNATDGILFSGGIIVLFFVMLIVMSRNDTPFENCLVISSWISFVISTILWYAELTPIILSFLFLTLAAGTTLYLVAGKGTP